MINYIELNDKISNWLKDYLDNSSLETYVIGVSGGIDSALVSTLCAMTGKPVHVFNIPIKSSSKNINLSNLHCRWLKEKFKNVTVHTVDITDVYEKLCLSFTDIKNYPLANANTKSRLRMVLLYHYAASLNGLVFGVGFFTKYGDGGVDLSPIGDLTKTEVRNCAKVLDIETEIIEAQPTDGLWEDERTDEGQIGASYHELEWAMDYIDNEKNEQLSARQNKVLDIFMGFRKKNKHKILPIPVFKK